MNEEKKQMLIRVIGTAIVLILIIGGVYFLVKKDSANRQNNNSQDLNNQASAILSLKSDDWIKGKKDAKVIIIDYADYQCPACAYASSALNEVYNAYPNDVALIYRNFPLNYHQFGMEAAVSAEIAGETGKFWEMHDALFISQDKLSHEEILNIAENLGFNRTDFERKMQDKKYQDAVYKDQLEAEDLNLDHTPTLYINGIEYTGNLDKESIINEIKKYL